MPFHLSERHDLDAPGRRRIARAWGVVSINDDGSVQTTNRGRNPPPRKRGGEHSCSPFFLRHPAPEIARDKAPDNP